MKKEEIIPKLERIITLESGPDSKHWKMVAIKAFNLGIELAAENAKSISTYPSYRVDEGGELVFHDINKEDILKLKL